MVDESSKERRSALAVLVARLDWLSDMGARALRALAAAAAIAAAACWAALFSLWDGAGWAALAVASVPAAVLWFSARAVRAAVDATRLEASISGVRDRAAKQAGDVVGAWGSGGFGRLLAAFRAVRAVREVRKELDRLGIDMGNWAIVANPMSLVAVGLSVVSTVILAVLAALAGLVRLVA